MRRLPSILHRQEKDYGHRRTRRSFQENRRKESCPKSKKGANQKAKSRNQEGYFEEKVEEVAFKTLIEKVQE